MILTCLFYALKSQTSQYETLATKRIGAEPSWPTSGPMIIRDFVDPSRGWTEPIAARTMYLEPGGVSISGMMGGPSMNQRRLAKSGPRVQGPEAEDYLLSLLRA